MPYKDVEVQRDYQKKWAAQRRSDYFVNKACAECGSTDRMELDHIDPKDKVYNPSTIWGMSDSNPNKIAELAKCQVLCYACHKEKTFFQTYGVPEHGTFRMYSKHGCRCTPCRRSNAENQRRKRSRSNN